MYRIKIEEKNNGEKGYTPQTCKLEIFGGLIKRQSIVWYNIIHSHGNTFGLSKTVSAAYRTEESALKVIDDYKNIIFLILICVDSIDSSILAKLPKNCINYLTFILIPFTCLVLFISKVPGKSETELDR